MRNTHCRIYLRTSTNIRLSVTDESVSKSPETYPLYPAHDDTCRVPNTHLEGFCNSKVEQYCTTRLQKVRTQ